MGIASWIQRLFQRDGAVTHVVERARVENEPIEERARLAFHARSEAEIRHASQPVPDPVRTAMQTATRPAIAWGGVSDEQFEGLLENAVPLSAREKCFYSKIAGTSHRNRDGSSRTRAIRECSVMEQLDLQHEPENPYDPNAVAVLRKSGEQLGYLDARLAGEVVRDARRSPGLWMAIFRHANHHPETDRVVGAVIYLIRLAEKSS